VLEIPSPADGFYLAFYPAAYAGLVLLVRRHVRRSPASLWLDGAIQALAVAAVATAILSRPIINDVHGGVGQLATDAVYPLADLVLLSLVVGAFAMTRWRAGRGFSLLCASLAIAALADGWFLYAQSSNTYVDGRPLDSLWLLSALLIAWAAWEPTDARPRAPALDGSHHAAAAGPDPENRPQLAVPIASAMAALGLLVADHVTPPFAAWRPSCARHTSASTAPAIRTRWRATPFPSVRGSSPPAARSAASSGAARTGGR
jgi:hypothetical protein